MNLVPLPASVRERPGVTFALGSRHAAGGDPDGAAIVARVLGDQAGAIAVALDPGDPGDESYSLDVGRDEARLSARSPAGVLRGAHTLAQLATGGTLPGITIHDRPRFAWRGLMLDVARHFFGVADVKRLIDLMATCKLNTLHLHLTDDQGWRIEIESWPRLAEHGGRTAVGGAPGGHYTKDDYRELVAYAAERFITVVPEIDLPGHTNAALAAYPELGGDGQAPEPYTGTDVGFSSLRADLDVTYRFIDDVVREVAALTPGPWLHIGGDEARSTSRDDYVTLIERAQAIVTSHGKRVAGWEEMATAPLAPGALVQYWNTGAPQGRELARTAVAQGARVLLSPADRAYLDMKYDAHTDLGLEWAGHVEVRDAYEWDPAALIDGVGEADVIGVEAAIWSETLATMADVERMAFPRLAAVAEVAWSPPARDWDGFAARLAAQAPRWEALGVRFHRSPQVPWP